MKFLSQALFAALTCCSPALAVIPGQADPADVAAIDACLRQAKDGSSPSQACIGAVAAKCQTGVPTPQAKTSCNEREERVWVAAGVRDFARLDALLGNNASRQALREAQMGFERAKFGRCTFERVSRDNSPEALLSASKCRLDATADQAFWLSRQIEVLGGK